VARKKKKKKSKVKKSGKKSRKVKKSRKISRRRKKSKKSKKRKKSRTKARRINFKAPTYSKDSDGNSVIKVSDSWANHAYVNESKYKKKYKMSIK
jgi:hypothetical protein